MIDVFTLFSGHPDPNLTYASELVSLLGLQADGSLKPADKHEQDQQALPAELKAYLDGKLPDFGAAADGDAVGTRKHIKTLDSILQQNRAEQSKAN